MSQNIRGVKTRNKRNRRKILKSMLKTLKVKRNQSAVSPVRSPKKENKNPVHSKNIFFSISPTSDR